MKIIADYRQCIQCDVSFDDELWTKCPRCGLKPLDSAGYGARPLEEDSSDEINASPDSWSRGFFDEEVA